MVCQSLNILSLFDGIAVACLAATNFGIPCNYYASEIDKYAIQVTAKNYPEIKQVGDVGELTASSLPAKIDLMIGGSPCQNLSCRGDHTGLKGTKSKLFFDYLRLLKEIKPRYFVLENVASMSHKNRDIISGHLGVEPIFINSHCFVPQTRRRYYWTNIPVKLPEDHAIDISVQDMLECDVADKFFYNKHAKERSFWINSYNTKPQADLPIARPLKTQSYTGRASVDNCYHVEQQPSDPDRTNLRRLTPLEYERLQGLPDNYAEGVSDTQRYKLVGNSFTAPVIQHILSYMEY